MKAYVAANPYKGLGRLRAMYQRWPFFLTLPSNMDMALAKGSLAITSSQVLQSFAKVEKSRIAAHRSPFNSILVRESKHRHQG